MQDNILKVVFFADIIGRPGRKLIFNHFDKIISKYNPDFIVANIENIAGGFGITKKLLEEFNQKVNIDAFTTGNHIWDKKEFEKDVNSFFNLLIPANFPEGVPGCRYLILEKNSKKLGIFNLLGRALMGINLECPFKVAKATIQKIKEKTNCIFIDFHAEATSEKSALAFYLDGEVSAIIGTHTHVQTSDERIMEKGTAFLTDAGMTGVFDSVIGYDEKNPIKKFLTQMPKRYEVKTKGIFEIQGAYIEIFQNTGKAKKIERIKYRIE